MTAFFLEKWIPSSKRLLLALGFLDCVKARLDPSPFLCPQGLWLWLGDATGIKRAQDDSVFFGVLVLRFFWADFLVKTTRFFSEGEEIAQIETECRNWDSYY
jgi:hypothetical protein